MRRITIPILGLAVFAMTTILSAPVFAQGQGGYGPGVPGAETVRMSNEERAHMRALHQTNDTSGGRSSIDKSGKTWEAGGTIEGPQPGTIGWDIHRGRGGASGVRE
ncbi:MAG TPA: hypothetical protein VGM26_13610 [Rhizomicrobium sp.]|jgi:hypothetical protein